MNMDETESLAFLQVSSMTCLSPLLVCIHLYHCLNLFVKELKEECNF